MRKILSLTILLAMVFAAFVFLPARAEDNSAEQVLKISDDGLTATVKNVTLEKIPSPDQIRYFKVIKKEGTALWGIRLSKEESNAIVKNDDSSKTDVRSQIEKILAPQYINLYNKVTKIGDSLWGIPKKATEVRIRPVDAGSVACVSAAIDKKDGKIKEIISTSTVALSAAITTRGECQKKAIATLEKQAENLAVCIKNFQKTNNNLMTKAHNAQKEAWTTYQQELRACSVASSTASTTGLATGVIMIEDGGSNSLGLIQ